MLYYKIFKSVDDDEEYVVEMFNHDDIIEVQKALVEKGYMIEYMIDYGYHGHHAFMKVTNKR